MVQETVPAPNRPNPLRDTVGVIEDGMIGNEYLHLRGLVRDAVIRVVLRSIHLGRIRSEVSWHVITSLILNDERSPFPNEVEDSAVVGHEIRANLRSTNTHHDGIESRQISRGQILFTEERDVEPQPLNRRRDTITATHDVSNSQVGNLEVEDLHGELGRPIKTMRLDVRIRDCGSFRARKC